MDPPAAADAGASQTDWSMIYIAAHGEREPAAEAWDQLARRYWPAIYAYIRSSGRDVHAAADLTQGFIADVMVGRNLLETADPKRGRFRTLLLTALKRYVIEQHRRSRRRKRNPQSGQVIDLDPERALTVSLDVDANPELAFAAQWSAMLIRRVLDRVRSECVDQQLDPHWTVFEARVVRPMLLGEQPTPYAELVERLGLKGPAQAANMMITVKRRYARALAAEVRGTVADPADLEDELNVLHRALEHST
jgi:RNA polymerase sigma factor (sigma-70 family)